MKIIELIKFNRKSMEVMSRFDIKQSDCQYVELYEEYNMLRDKKEKYRYIIASLAEKYHISESSVKRLIKRLSIEVIL
jgi:DNA-binding MarR family transcriptional regulator